MNIGDLSLKYIETLKYAYELEGKLKIQTEEIEKLQYLTRFMIINQRNREEMIAHLFEENRRLKEIIEKNRRNIPMKKVINLIPARVSKFSNESFQKSSALLKEKKDQHIFFENLNEMSMSNCSSYEKQNYTLTYLHAYDTIDAIHMYMQ